MTKHNQERRGGAPQEKLQMLNEFGVEQFNNAHNRNMLCDQLVWSSFEYMYPEVMRSLRAQANRQAEDTLTRMGQGATQGAVVQAPAQWSPRQETNPDAPQGHFDDRFIREELDRTGQGFDDLRERQVDRMPDQDHSMSDFEELLRQQAGQQLEDA